MRTHAINKPLLVAIFGTALFTALLLSGGTLLSATTFPDHGADAIQHLYSPHLAGAGAFTTTTGGAPASAVNPAQGGEAQRIVFNVGYMGLAGLGEDDRFGSAVDMGLLLPTRFAVFGTSIRFIHSPFSYAFPVGSAFSGNLNVAKEVFPRMSVGAGLNFGFGTDNIARDWTLTGDLGFRWNTGNLGPLENFTWAATLRSMGRSWAPTWFTPAGGVSFDLLRIRGRDGGRDPLLINAQADLELPSIIHFDWISLIFKAGLRFEIAETVNLSVSWPSGSGLNARELAQGGAFPWVPSVGLAVNIPLPTGGRVAGGRLPTDGDLRTDLAFRPLYEGVTAMGAGITWNVGIADTRPPVITIAHTDTLYFSPNNDGRADFLEFPIVITDERYVASWYWEIRDEDGGIVRTIRNRELRPQTINFRNFMGNLFSVREHVEVPPTLRWDGIADSGELAPDGRYFFTITAADDSGNTVTSQVFQAVLRNAPPEIAIEPLADAMRIFSPGGARSTITFTPHGSYEHAWESGIYDVFGNRVRTFDIESGNPAPRVWDGRNDHGVIVPDGVYTYRISATDRAMNHADASMTNIIVNTIRPQVSVFISDPWFSPGTASDKDTLAMSLNVPSRDEVTEWTIRIRDSQGNVRRTILHGQGSPGTTWAAVPAATPVGTPVMIASVPDLMHFDGRNDAGAILEEGVFTAELSVQYMNGFVSTAMSPAFNLRTTPPQATVRADYIAFAPVADSIQQEMIFRLEGSNELQWTGEIRRADHPGEAPVRTFHFSGYPPAELRWNGHGEAGTFAADGEYTFHLFSMDQAGNRGQSNVLRFTLSTRDVPVMIKTDFRAFSPTGPRGSINLMAQVQETDGVVSHRVDIRDSAGQIVRTFQGQGLPPAAISWDGRNAANVVVPEGMYTARLEVLYAHGIHPHAITLPFEVDMTPPRATVSAPYTIFSPHGRRSTIPFNVSTEANDEWEASVVNAAGTPIRTWNWRGTAPQIFWDGRDQAGNMVADGTYQFVLQSVDEAGNSARHTVPGIVLDARIPQLILTASETAIAPRPGQQNAELVRFGIITSLTEGIESWSLEIRDEDGASLRRFASAPPNSPVPPPPATISWNGLTEGGGLREGLFTPVLTVNYIKGDVAVTESAPILVHVTGPALSFAAQPRYFTPDNDGVDDELYIGLAAVSPVPIESWYMEILQPVAPFHVFHRMEGRGSPAERLIWDGRNGRGELVQSAMNYPVRFSATDRLGNSSTIDAEVGVGILVIRDGDRLRIQVPAIIFAANATDFSGLPAYQVENNLRVLRQVAESLNRFRDYRITVEGHANPTSPPGPARNNEAPILQRLSEARARTVLDHLVRNGVNRNRMTSVGIGGNSPIVAFEEHDLWWQNRRVEFILVR